MRVRTSYFVRLVFLSVALAWNLGCARHPYNGDSHRPRYDAERIGRRAISQFDANGDGKLEGKELDKCPGLKAALGKLNSIGCRGVTASAIIARLRQWEESRLGRTRIICIVTHNGKPLVGAQVKFVPEKFLGGNALTASGVTDRNGMAKMDVPKISRDSDVPVGVPPGFYRVEITKSSENVPSMYNTDTTLGVEVALDSEQITEQNIGGTVEPCVTFTLSY